MFSRSYSVLSCPLYILVVSLDGYLASSLLSEETSSLGQNFPSFGSCWTNTDLARPVRCSELDRNSRERWAKHLTHCFMNLTGNERGKGKIHDLFLAESEVRLRCVRIRETPHSVGQLAVRTSTKVMCALKSLQSFCFLITSLQWTNDSLKVASFRSIPGGTRLKMSSRVLLT